jgi:predicted phage terminase large subunit-like protein
MVGRSRYRRNDRPEPCLPAAADGRMYVLEDLSGKFGPDEWARRAVNAYHRWKADRIIGEKNNGGDMIETVIRSVEKNVSYRAVHASRGKLTRAEPISALYEQGKVGHVGSGLAILEDQMCAFTSDFDRGRAGYSPDRLDALVWALTELSGTRPPMVITPELLARSAQPGPPRAPVFRQQRAFR